MSNHNSQGNTVNNQLPALQFTNPALYNKLVEHPEIRVVDCYFHIESLQFYTMWFAIEKLRSLEFTREEISEAFKIYMTA